MKSLIYGLTVISAIILTGCIYVPSVSISRGQKAASSEAKVDTQEAIELGCILKASLAEANGYVLEFVIYDKNDGEIVMKPTISVEPNSVGEVVIGVPESENELGTVYNSKIFGDIVTDMKKPLLFIATRASANEDPNVVNVEVFIDGFGGQTAETTMSIPLNKDVTIK